MRSCSSNSLQATSATYGSKQIWETTTVVTSKSRNGGFLIYCIILSLVNHDKIVTLFWQNTQSFFWAEKVALPPVLFGCLVVKSLKKKKKKKRKKKEISNYHTKFCFVVCCSEECSIYANCDILLKQNESDRPGKSISMNWQYAAPGWGENTNKLTCSILKDAIKGHM